MFGHFTTLYMKGLSNKMQVQRTFKDQNFFETVFTIESEKN